MRGSLATANLFLFRIQRPFDNFGLLPAAVAGANTMYTNMTTFLNVEIKARCSQPDAIRNYLLEHQADFKGTDHQCDTYFRVHNGRLKLREGNIENNLIYYERSDQAGPKQSHFQLVNVEDAAGLKEALTRANGVKVVVKKKREIYYIRNVKFHVDEVPGLGSFIEIEAGNRFDPELDKEQLQEQCNFYLQAFGVQPQDLVEVSYSDMLMQVSG